jgi:hypothetical protein
MIPVYRHDHLKIKGEDAMNFKGMKKCKRVMFVMLSTIIIAAMNIAASPAITNGNFEQVASNGNPAGWIPLDFGWDVEKAGNLFFVSRDAHSGKGAAAIVLNTFEKGWSAAPLTGLKPETWYELSVWTKSNLQTLSGKGPTVFILRHLPGSTRIGNSPDTYLGSYAMGKNSGDWQEIKFSFKTKEKTDHLYACIGLYDAIGTGLFDDMKVKEITEKEAEKIKKEFVSYNGDKDLLKSKNLIVNSSFEIMTAPYMPDAWTHAMHYPGYKRDFYEAIRVVEDNPFHGKRCFKIKNGEMRYVGKVVGAKKLDSPSILSFYLRSDEPEAEFSVFGKKFKPVKEWKRYSIKLPAGKKADFWVKTKGTIYLDAFQMEIGDTPTSYLENHRDAVLTAAIPLPSLAPEIKLNKKISIENLNLAYGKKSTKKTSCVISKHANALHIRFECHGRNYKDLEKNITQRDDYVFTDDSVSVSINPGVENGQNKAFIFEVNAIGTQRDAYGIDATWNTEWKSSTGKLKDGYWAELTIPYAALNDAFATSVWQINLIRQSATTKTEKKEVSAWFNPGTIQVEETGMLVSGFTNLSKYQSTIGEPTVLLCNTRNSAPWKEYEVNFEVGFADKNSRKGNAMLSLSSGFKQKIAWKSDNGIALLKFKKFSEDQIMDFKNYDLTISENRKPIAIKHFNKRLTVQPLLKVGPLDRSYYTSEKQARLQVEVPIDPLLADKFELDVQILGAMKRISHKRYPAKSAILDIDLPELKLGKYTVKVNLVNANSGAKIFAFGEVPLTKLPPSKMEVKVNQINRMMVINGKEYINHGFSVSAQSRKLKAMQKRMTYLVPDIKEIAKRFTSIGPLYATLDKDRDQTIPILKDLVNKFTQAGLDVTMCIPQIGTVKSFDPGSDFFKDHFDALKEYKMKDWPIIAWYQFDEAYGWWEKNKNNKESDLIDFYWQLKDFDPYRLFYTDTCYVGRIYGGVDHADWIGGSYYPIGTYPPSNLVAGVRGFVMATEKARANLNARIVTGGFLPCFAYERGREPSAEEYKACTYLMLIHGCRAMNMWMYATFSQTLWDSMIPLKKELEFLSPVFAQGDNVSSLIAGSNNYVDFTVYQYQNKTYLLAANYSPEKITAAFDLNLLKSNGEASEVFEKRKMTLKSGILTDIFAGYGCHVYEIK